MLTEMEIKLSQTPVIFSSTSSQTNSQINSNHKFTNSTAFNILKPPPSREMPVPVGSDPAADERGQRQGVDRAWDRVHQHRGENDQGKPGTDQAGD